MNQFQNSACLRHLDRTLRVGDQVAVVATGESGVVLCRGRDKTTSRDVVCVELHGKVGMQRWGLYPPDAVAFTM